MKKKYLAFFCIALSVVLLLGGVVLFWTLRYRAMGLSPLFDLEGEFRYNGKLLVSEEGEKAILYKPLGNERYETIKVETIDLSPFGFEGVEFPYFRVETDAGYGVSYINYYPVGEEYEPFWSVCMGERIVYLAEDGKKYRIHTKENLSYPVFSDSIEGVDPYGTDVIAFSANATYAIALDGTDVTVYKTDPTDDSLRVVEKKTYSLAKYGESAVFGAFVGNTDAYFILTSGDETKYVAFSCQTGETALSSLDPEGEYGPAVSRLYAQKIEKEAKMTWSHLLLGTEVSASMPEGAKSAELLSVSPAGKYAVFSVETEAGTELLALNEKRGFSFISLIPQGETVEQIEFIYENVIAVFCENEAGEGLVHAFKICF